MARMALKLMAKNVQNAQPPSSAKSTVEGDFDDFCTAALASVAGMKNPNERLVALRKRAGYASAADCARAMGMKSETTYQQHENGTRPISRQAATRYSRFFRVPISTFLDDPVLRPHVTVSIVGLIEHHGNINPMPDGTHFPKEAPIPPGAPEGLQALLVADDSLWPVYRKGDAVYYRTLSPIVSPSDIDGLECIVETDLGHRFIRHVTTQPDGVYTLLAYNRPPEMHVRLRAASPVSWVQRRAFQLP